MSGAGRELLSGAPLCSKGHGIPAGSPSSSQRSGSRHSRDPDKNKAAPGGGEGAAGACDELRRSSAPGPAPVGPPPPGEREKSLRREGLGRGRARNSAGVPEGYWLSLPSIPTPPPIATQDFAGLKGGALGPAWANSEGEGGRGPHGHSEEGGPRWRQGGGPADTALPVPPPQALAAVAPSSARGRGPFPPRGDRPGTRGRGPRRLRRTGLPRLLPARPVTFPRPRRAGV